MRIIRTLVVALVATAGIRLYAQDDPTRVLILVNDATPPETGTGSAGASVFVGQYYAAQRHIPTSNIVHINMPLPSPAAYDAENVPYTAYDQQIRQPLAQFLQANNLVNNIDFIVPTYGIPLKVINPGMPPGFVGLPDTIAIDSLLASINSPSLRDQLPNGYFAAGEQVQPKFRNFVNPWGYRMYLVTRLDGPSAMIAKGLVDKAITAEQTLGRADGTAYFDFRHLCLSVTAASDDYCVADVTVLGSSRASQANGFTTVLNDQGLTAARIAIAPNALWSWGWYNNYAIDGTYSFVNGAVGAQLSSGSADNIRSNTAGNWVANFLTNGITATWGSVAEPGVAGFTKGDSVLRRLWAGFNFAESVYMATDRLNYRMVFIGDPLYSPLLFRNSTEAPIAIPFGGQFPNPVSVTLSTLSPGAQIYYTLDGSSPTTSSTPYTAPITVSVNGTLKAFAVRANATPSPVLSVPFDIVSSYTVGPLTPSPAPGTYSNAVDVSLTTSTPGVTIYYTLDGSTPSPSTSVYSGPIHLTASGWVRALAVKPNFTSAFVEGYYAVQPGPVPPSISPNGGTFGACTDVTLSTTVTGASIYYTLDGSVPTQASTLYATPIHLTQNSVVSAKVFTATQSSSVAQATFNVTCNTAPVAASTVATPGGGTFTGYVDVTLSTATAGATIYYTLDASTPTTSSPVYSSPIHLTASSWVRSIAAKTGYQTSASVDYYFTIVPGTAVTPAAPVLSPNGGAYTTCPDVFLSTATTGAFIYYTLDGTIPTQNSTLYNQPIHLTQTAVVTARAFAGANWSAATSATFNVSCSVVASVAPLQVAPAGGTFAGSVDVTLTTTTTGASIYYTLDGSGPTTNSTLYTAPIHLTSSAWIRAIGTKSGSTQSPTAEFYYLITAATQPPPAPVFSPSGGTYSTCPDVTLSVAPSGAAIYYTTDGTTPTQSSTLYTQAIHLTQSATISARAYANTLAGSVSQAVFTVNCGAGGPVAPLSVSPAGGTFTGSVDVTLATATPGAAIFYSLDGSTPGPLTSTYTGPIHLTSSGWVRAIANKAGYTPSPGAEFFFTVLAGPVAPAPPVLSPNGGTFSVCPDVTLTAPTSGAAIYYTLDGTAPTQASALYAQPIHLTQSTVITARALASALWSTAAQASFTVNCTSSLPLTAPTVSPAGGTFTGSVDVALTAIPGAQIYYTLDGSTPGTNTTLYAAPIHLTSSGWIRSVAVLNGVRSPGAEFYYVIQPGPQPPATPVITPGGGTFSTCPAVSITDATPGAVLYYTLDGTAPTMSSAAYSAPFTLSTSALVRAKAFLSTTSSSAEAQAQFTVNCLQQPPAAPTVTPSGGTFTGSVDVTITATAGAVIYYTIDGSAPTLNARVYTGPIHLINSLWIRTAAYLGGQWSPTTERLFLIN